MTDSAWELVGLGDAVEFLDSQRRPVKVGDRAKMRGSIPYYGASGVVDRVNRYLFDEDLILLGEDGENILSRAVPLAFKISGKAWVNNHAHVLRARRGFDIDFLVAYLECLDYSGLNSGTAQPKLNKQSCLTVQVPRPTIAEQKRIAKALSDIDSLIASLGDLIAKKRAIKQGMMQELLAVRASAPGVTRALSSISSFITKGATPTTYGFRWETSGVPFLRSECVSAVGLDMRQAMFISPEADIALARSRVRDGDILMTITGNVGRVVRLAGLGLANINQHIARIRVTDPAFDSYYVFHFLSQPSVRAHYESITTGQAYPQISLAQVRATGIPAIPLKEQRTIASSLSDADAEIQALERRLEATRAVKQGMMQELLTGRTRLVPAEVSA